MGFIIATGGYHTCKDTRGGQFELRVRLVGLKHNVPVVSVRVLQAKGEDRLSDSDDLRSSVLASVGWRA